MAPCMTQPWHVDFIDENEISMHENEMHEDANLQRSSDWSYHLRAFEFLFNAPSRNFYARKTHKKKFLRTFFFMV